MTIEERIANLERELANAKQRTRRLMFAGIVLVAASGATWLASGGEAQAQALVTGRATGTIRAREFIVESNDGKERAKMSSTDGSGTSLQLCDENGKVRVLLSVGTKWVGLSLSDDNSKPRAALSASNQESMLTLKDENGRARVSLDAGNPAVVGQGLRLSDENDKTRISLGMFGGDPSIKVYNETSKLILIAPQER